MFFNTNIHCFLIITLSYLLNLESSGYLDIVSEPDKGTEANVEMEV